MIEEPVLCKGDVERIVEWKDGRTERIEAHNTVLLTGRRALAKCLANAIGDGFNFYITRMLFGDGGTTEGIKKYVNANRNGLFGVIRLSKPVISTLDSVVPAQVIFTSIIRFDEAVGVTLNEMALQMATGDLYSMITFPDLNKTEDMQLTFNWRIQFV
jgi:hypothetical protein